MDTHFHYDFALLPHYLDLLRARLRIAVVYGGDKNQPGSVIYKAGNPRAWKSYEAVARDIQAALKELGFAYVVTFPDDMRLPKRLADAGIHLVWLNTGGVQGHHPMSHAPALLEMLGIPYVGHNPLNAALLDTKDAFKRGLQALGIKTAPFMTWHPSQGALQPEANRTFNAAFGSYCGPFVVKPVSGRASLHVHLAESLDVVLNVVNQVYHETHNNVLIETYLPGREYCVAVCGAITCIRGTLTQRPAPFACSALERTLEAGETIFTSMDHKPITTNRFRLLNDAESVLKHELTTLAQAIYTKFSLQSIVRVDARADNEGNLYVLEANPKPDLKKPTDSVMSLVMADLPDGMSYNDMILGLLADRLHYLLSYEREGVAHLIDLLIQGKCTNIPFRKQTNRGMMSGAATRASTTKLRSGVTF